jgi:hypothetical protein
MDRFLHLAQNEGLLGSSTMCTPCASSEPEFAREDLMNIFIVDLKHQPGELAKATEALAHKGIDITAFSGVTCGGSGTVALLTSDEIGTRSALSGAGFRARELEVVTTSVENTPGSLAKTARKLADAGISIEAALPTAMSGLNVTIAFATDNPAKARSVLGAREPVGAAR